MTRKEAIKIIDCYDIGFYDLSGEKIPADKLADAFDMAIEALQADVVRCENCKHQEHCYQTVSHTKIHDGFKEYWSEPIEWCSRGERKGGDSE